MASMIAVIAMVPMIVEALLIGDIFDKEGRVLNHGVARFELFDLFEFIVDFRTIALDRLIEGGIQFAEEMQVFSVQLLATLAQLAFVLNHSVIGFGQVTFRFENVFFQSVFTLTQNQKQIHGGVLISS